MFSDYESSHAHSRLTLDILCEYNDFMESIKILCDMGCGAGLDLEWWATRTTGDDETPLNIICQGVDKKQYPQTNNKLSNIKFRQDDFENLSAPFKQKFDLIWCHDAFQYALNPIKTLITWRELLNPDGMLLLIIPQTTNVQGNILEFDQPDYVYHNWTMVSLIHTLAISGFDCSQGYFLKRADDPWLHAVVYRSELALMDPKVTRWYHLAEAGLLPESAVASINKHGYLRQRDLTLPWLDRSHHWLGQN